MELILKGKSMTKWIAYIASLIVIGGCSIQAPKQDDNPQTYSRSLQRYHAQNKQLKQKRKHKQKTPHNVLSGLTPKPTTKSQTKAEQRFDVNVDNAPVRSFFKSLVEGTDKSVMLSPDLDDQVSHISLNLKNVTIFQVLEAVRDTYNIEYKQTNYGYRIYPAKLETRSFHVDYLNVKRNSQSETSINSGQLTQMVGGQQDQGNGGGGSNGDGQQKLNRAPTRIRTKSKTDFWKDLEATSKSIVTEENGRHVTVNSQAGLVMVKAYPSELRQVKKYLDTIQKTINREVIIEARVLEVKLDAKTAAGIDLNFPRFKKKLVNNLISNAFSSSASFANPFSITISSDNSLKSAIKVLNEQGEINVLSSPRISTANNQPSLIKVGTDEFFITDVENDQTTGGGGTISNNQDVTLTPFFSGIALEVTPHITGDKNITLHVHPVISDVTDQTKSFTVNGNQQSVPTALSDIRESDSIVEAKSGQIVVIGGLMKNETDNKHGTAPILSRIPLIGKLLNNQQKDSTKTELVIIMRPQVVNHHSNQQELENTARHFKNMQKPYQYKWQLANQVEQCLKHKG